MFSDVKYAINDNEKLSLTISFVKSITEIISRIFIMKQASSISVVDYHLGEAASVDFQTGFSCDFSYESRKRETRPKNVVTS